MSLGFETMRHSSRWLKWLLLLLVFCILLAGGTLWIAPKPKSLFRFKVPANSRISLLWESDDGSEGRRIELRADPGDQLQIAIEPGDPDIPALDELPKDTFFETPADPGAEAQVAPELFQQVRLVAFENRPLVHSRFRFFWESYEHPLLAQLRAQEKLDEVVSGAESELDLFARVMHWTHRQWEVGQPDPYPPWNALVILDWIRSGKTKGFCAQYAQVMVQALLSFGHQARYVSLANHEVLEVWSNQFCKWIVMDPNDDVYYTDGKTPVNAYEIYLALKEGRTNALRPVGGSNNPGRFQSYGVFSISTRNDHLSQGRTASDYLRDMWKERVHLITPHHEAMPYHEGKLRPITPFASDLYFPLNTAHVKILRPVGPERVEIWIDTNTPGFAGFQASSDGAEFVPIQPRHVWNLHPGRNEIRLVSGNLKGVRGPQTRIVVESSVEGGVSDTKN